MTAWNLFRILGDSSHLAAKLILLFSIHRNRSAEGVSLITQVLYAIVFCSRYTDLFDKGQVFYNVCFKIFYILSSFYTIGVMRWVFPRTREKELAWKMGAGVFFGSLLLSPFAMLIFPPWSWFYFLWDFSQILESVCVLPQLLLLRQTSVPTVIDSYYLVALGSYRALYLINWIQRELDVNDQPPRAISVIFGIVQTALYVDFAWVYYTRQRVKLRSGGVVDADDLRRGWLLNRIFGKHVVDNEDEDEESRPALGLGRDDNSGPAGGRAPRAKWGKRGISVSADEGVLDQEPYSNEEHGIVDVEGSSLDPDARMKDPDELARVLDDDDDDEDAPLPSAHGESSGIRGGDEWRD